ncbi:DUF3570 domain-containing protein [Wenyingzhuangia marina]|uniref:DUF3570 domain-containing protein n=1 Tax=Wenyingzhuangia marina TaxID=1195760 RepID=A0A1M5V7X2_9FLAO|nr:DUF3570 domain-containing protein [Wenyingzhuangia marina]GGF73831.1 hypothetical protein GCM10011397_15920 [Wenyingzhuangia marina]SHH71327.1 Protein of unknown function [Wenyingzhuangia marina]
MKTKYIITLLILVGSFVNMFAQTEEETPYKKRVLENTEVDFLTSAYYQDGENAAAGGGIGSEKILDGTGAIVVAVPMNADDILKVDASVSAYTSASSSNINPFDSDRANPYVASSGASSNDVWVNLTTSYTHSSDDRNQITSGKFSVSNEFDYFSLGFGGSYSRLFNEKNTELSVHGSVYLDQWKLIYPVELRDSNSEREGYNPNNITGTGTYQPNFTSIDSKARNSYSVGFGFSQILSKKLQSSLALDLVQQNGLLSTPFHRIYFSDKNDFFVKDFQLADDIERLPSTRNKIAAGLRLNYYINEIFVLRSYYRYYTDSWGIKSNTASLEIPIKISPKFTIYTAYRYYNQTAVNYFAGYEQHLSTEEYYTSDYDLSKFHAHQYTLGMSYTDIFTEKHLWKFAIKSIDVKINKYNRDSSFKSYMITAGIKFILDEPLNIPFLNKKN